jgi:hypothetical protein
MAPVHYWYVIAYTHTSLKLYVFFPLKIEAKVNPTPSETNHVVDHIASPEEDNEMTRLTGDHSDNMYDYVTYTTESGLPKEAFGSRPGSESNNEREEEGDDYDNNSDYVVKMLPMTRPPGTNLISTYKSVMLV